MKDKIKTDLLEALISAQKHLDFCGYGDSYERECAEAQGLEVKIQEAVNNANTEIIHKEGKRT